MLPNYQCLSLTQIISTPMLYLSLETNGYKPEPLSPKVLYKHKEDCFYEVGQTRSPILTTLELSTGLRLHAVQLGVRSIFSPYAMLSHSSCNRASQSCTSEIVPSGLWKADLHGPGVRIWPNCWSPVPPLSLGQSTHGQSSILLCYHC